MISDDNDIDSDEYERNVLSFLSQSNKKPKTDTSCNKQLSTNNVFEANCNHTVLSGNENYDIGVNKKCVLSFLPSEKHELQSNKENTLNNINKNANLIKSINKSSNNDECENQSLIQSSSEVKNYCKMYKIQTQESISAQLPSNELINPIHKHSSPILYCNSNGKLQNSQEHGDNKLQIKNKSKLHLCNNNLFVGKLKSDNNVDNFHKKVQKNRPITSTVNKFKIFKDNNIIKNQVIVKNKLDFNKKYSTNEISKKHFSSTSDSEYNDCVSSSDAFPNSDSENSSDYNCYNSNIELNKRNSNKIINKYNTLPSTDDGDDSDNFQHDKKLPEKDYTLSNDSDSQETQNLNVSKNKHYSWQSSLNMSKSVKTMHQNISSSTCTDSEEEISHDLHDSHNISLQSNFQSKNAMRNDAIPFSNLESNNGCSIANLTECRLENSFHNNSFVQLPDEDNCDSDAYSKSVLQYLSSAQNTSSPVMAVASKPSLSCNISSDYNQSPMSSSLLLSSDVDNYDTDDYCDTVNNYLSFKYKTGDTFKVSNSVNNNPTDSDSDSSCDFWPQNRNRKISLYKRRIWKILENEMVKDIRLEKIEKRNKKRSNGCQNITAKPKIRSTVNNVTRRQKRRKAEKIDGVINICNITCEYINKIIQNNLHNEEEAEIKNSTSLESELKRNYFYKQVQLHYLNYKSYNVHHDKKITKDDNSANAVLQISDSKKLSCDLCDISFNDLFSLDKHMYGLHEGDIINMCNHCGESYCDNSEFIKQNDESLSTSNCNELAMKCVSDIKQIVCDNGTKHKECISSDLFQLENNSVVRKENIYKCNSCKKSQIICTSNLQDKINFINCNFGGNFDLVSQSYITVLKCYICVLDFQTDSKLFEHLLKEHKFYELYKYKCNKCSVQFANKYKLEKHIIRDNCLFCHLCKSYRAENKEKFKNHINHHKTMFHKYLCKFCDKKFFTIRGCTNHIKIHHKNMLPYKCDKCDKKFVVRYKLREHQKNCHKNSLFFCGICDREYKCIYSFRQHNNIHHAIDDNTNKYICDSCNLIFNYKHFIVEHVSYKLNICPWCNLSQKCSTTLNQHINLNHRSRIDNKLQCTYCRYKINTIQQYKRHIILSHPTIYVQLNENSIICNKCNRVCSSKHHFRKHLRLSCLGINSNKSKIKYNNIVTSRSKSDNLKLCNYCDKKFKHKQPLINHLNYPSTLCKICNKKFNCASLLNEHILIAHKTDKQSDVFEKGNNDVVNSAMPSRYICNVCNNVYNSLAGLISHKKYIHSTNYNKISSSNDQGGITNRNDFKISDKNGTGNIKQYKCSYCVNKYNLLKHCKNHENNCINNKKYMCYNCKHVFNIKKELQLHFIINNHCVLCNKNFKCSNLLYNHLILLHKNVKFAYKCRKCEKKFISPPYFIQHYIKTHKIIYILRNKNVIVFKTNNYNRDIDNPLNNINVGSTSHDSIKDSCDNSCSINHKQYHKKHNIDRQMEEFCDDNNSKNENICKTDSENHDFENNVNDNCNIMKKLPDIILSHNNNNMYNNQLHEVNLLGCSSNDFMSYDNVNGSDINNHSDHNENSKDSYEDYSLVIEESN